VGGLPGLGADGDLSLEGGAGGTSNIIGGIRVSMGFGGGSLYGGSTRSPSNNEGLSGVSPGAGGSGAASSGSQSARNGGNGAAGIVIVWEYLK
jgi:hypothetical protein